MPFCQAQALAVNCCGSRTSNTKSDAPETVYVAALVGVAKRLINIAGINIQNPFLNLITKSLYMICC